jgi:tetratricopeptide (TPR) repeat protein
MKHLIAVLLCSAVILGCSDAPDVDTEAARKNLADGWTAYNRGDFSAALLNFERAINLDENLADAHNGLGWTHLSASPVSSINPQIITKAKGEFEEAVRIDNSNADAWLGLANTLFLRREKDSDFRAALRAINNALDADNGFFFRHDYQTAAELHALKAACYYYLDEIDLATSSIGTAIKIDPQNAPALALATLLEGG